MKEFHRERMQAMLARSQIRSWIHDLGMEQLGYKPSIEKTDAEAEDIHNDLYM